MLTESRDCPLMSVKEMEKSKRGNFDYATDGKSGFTVVHWHDNNKIMQHSFKQGWGLHLPKQQSAGPEMRQREWRPPSLSW